MGCRHSINTWRTSVIYTSISHHSASRVSPKSGKSVGCRIGRWGQPIGQQHILWGDRRSSFRPSSVCEIRSCVFRVIDVTLSMPSSSDRLQLQHGNVVLPLTPPVSWWNRSFSTRRRYSGIVEDRVLSESLSNYLFVATRIIIFFVGSSLAVSLLRPNGSVKVCKRWCHLTFAFSSGRALTRPRPSQ
jgi:hypothetical protein